MMPKKDHERDVELDKKIEALRRKNEVLMKRYQEVEEDRKKAEEEGMALQSRKGKADDLTITISKSTSDSRVVLTKPYSSGSPTAKGQQEAGPDRVGEGPQLGSGRGRRKQLMVTMAGKKGKRVVSERAERRPGPLDVKSPTEDGQGQHVESTGRGKQPTAKRDTAVQESESQQASTDLTIPTSKEEQEEYLRWKREREQIDRERVARHKNAKGQWRRAWDMDKTENMFSDKSLPERDRGPPGRGGRNTRRGHPKSNANSRGHEVQGKDKGVQNVPVVSSKAKGKDRLTGRARRWDANEEGEHLQTSESILEEFLEELDALADPEIDDLRDGDPKVKSLPSPDAPESEEVVSGSGSEGVEVSGGPPGPGPAAILGEDVLTQGKAEALLPRGSDKKVRFSEELIQGTPASHSTGTQGSACFESRELNTLKTSSPSKIKHEVQSSKQPLVSAKEDVGSPEDQGDRSAPVAQRQATEALVVSQTECAKKDSVPPAAPSSPPPEKACASLQDSSVQPAEHAKCNINNRNTEELIDSTLSVLSLGSDETHPTHTTSTDKALSRAAFCH
ncbi:coiled-coil domain-containing protein 9B [Polymixia lowei]